jgi:hypothetical protein
MCTTRHYSFANFEAKLGNTSPTCFVTKQATGCRHVSSYRLHPLISFEAQIDKPPPTWFWGSNQELSRWFWGPNHQTINLGFEAQTKKLSQWFWGQTTDKPSPPVLWLNQKTHASRLLHVYGADHTRRHPTSRSSDHRIPDLCLIIPDPTNASLHTE